MFNAISNVICLRQLIVLGSDQLESFSATLVTGHIILFSTSVIYSNYNFSFLLITKIPGDNAGQKYKI